jgi:peptidyl-prolyl cis-trans isomerase SurA
MKNIAKTILVILVAIYANTITAQSSLDKKTLVAIGNEPVTVGEFMKVYQKNNALSDTTYRESVKEYLDLFINFKLKVMEAEALKMDTASTFVKELEGYRTQLAKPYFVDESVNEALLQEAYNRELKDIRASHILIMVDENSRPEDTLTAYKKVMNIRDEILSGKKTFAEAAMEYSDDQSANDREAVQGQSGFRPGNKGDLGYFTVFNMVYPFESAAYNTPVGEISMPVRSRFGYHLVKVTDKRDAMGVAEVAHIFVAVRPEATEEDAARKTEKINNIYQKIQEGMTFEDAVKEYSEDKGSLQNEGKLSKFTSSRVVPEFVLVVDSLKVGEVAPPVRTLYGYHIIKLISRETPGTFADESAQLKERVTKDQRSHKSEDAVIASIKKDNKFKTYPKNKDAVIAAMDSSSLAGTFDSKAFNAMTNPVMKLGKTEYTQADFAKYVEKNQKKTEKVDKDIYANQLFDQFVNATCLDYMDQRLETMYPDFKDLMNEYHDGILLFNLTDEEVWSKAVKDTLGLQQFFDNHHDNYRFGERVDATVYKIRNKKDADKVATLIAESDNDGDLAKALDRDSIKSVRMTPGKFEQGTDNYIDAVEWKPGVTGPIKSDVEDLVVFVKIREVIPPQAKELKEARGLVTADYQTYLEKAWIEQLKEKYPVVVNKEVLELLLNKSN